MCSGFRLSIQNLMNMTDREVKTHLFRVAGEYVRKVVSYCSTFHLTMDSESTARLRYTLSVLTMNIVSEYACYRCI